VSRQLVADARQADMDNEGADENSGVKGKDKGKGKSPAKKRTTKSTPKKKIKKEETNEDCKFEYEDETLQYDDLGDVIIASR
jgi:hypothetical protein